MRNLATRPLVTAVMVTGKHANRRPLALAAVRCFQAQTWPNKELVIINDGMSLGIQGPTIQEFLLPAKKETTLGELRNRGLDRARGSWIIQWDDDDWSHASRIEVQMAAAGDHAVLLRHQVRYDRVSGSFYDVTAGPGHAGTILHPATPAARYPSERKHEDSHFWQRWFPNAVRLDNDPDLYLRLYHGANTFGRPHIILTPAHKKLARLIPPGPRRNKLRDIIRENYPRLTAKRSPPSATR